MLPQALSVKCNSYFCFGYNDLKAYGMRQGRQAALCDVVRGMVFSIYRWEAATNC